MIGNMKNENILDKIKTEGMNQGIWLAVQELAHDGRWTQAAEELVSSCGLTEDECRKLQEESGSFDDEMESFIARMILDKDDKITLSNIGYHEICSVFKCDIGSKEIELEVIESGNYSCDGCIFNNNIYCCRDTYCIDRDREDNTNVIYKEVKRS